MKKNEAITAMIELIESKKTTSIIYGAKDEQHNHAIVLLNFIKEKIN